MCISMDWPWKIAVANIPRRMKPGFCTSMRTFAVRMFGSRIGQDVADPAGQHPIGIGVEPDLGAVADVHVRQVVLVHVAHDPHVRQVGNREQVRRVSSDRTPAAFVTFCSVITPDTGAVTSMMLMPVGGLAGSDAEHAQVFRRLSTSTTALSSASWATSRSFCAIAPRSYSTLGALELRPREHLVGERHADSPKTHTRCPCS